MTEQKGMLAGQVALVTGGTKGIGLAVAQRLARVGAEVVICGTNEARLQQAVETRGSNSHGVTRFGSHFDGGMHAINAAVGNDQVFLHRKVMLADVAAQSGD